MKNATYREGPKAREAFDKGMAKLFQVPKNAVSKPTRKPKRKKASKD
jgi:hypothetical protein